MPKVPKNVVYLHFYKLKNVVNQHKMERKFSKQLLKWKNSAGRMPLIVTGARQVGKTYGLLEFGKMHYKNAVYLNFENYQDLHEIFERDLNPERIVRELSAKRAETILPDDTLLIFDEIQACERALTSLKYFCEDAPQYHIAAAGSLLGVTLNRSQFSFPVGKIDKISLYPLDFEEFLWALERKNGAGLIRECFETNGKFTAHSDFMDLYKLYLLVGGMPHVVSEYIQKQDFDHTAVLQRNINDAYIADMVKYAQPAETNKILAAFNSVPAQLAKENRKF
jgi:predicted AAA+ superfamily ATPase